MAPSRRKGGGKAAAIAAACRQWKVGDLVLAKVKGFPAWPAAVSEPEKWGYTTDWKKVLVHFFGTQQIAFCSPADVEAFTEEKKQSLLTKRHAKGSDFVRALKEIIESYDKLKQPQQAGDPKSPEEATLGDAGNTTLPLQVSENPTETSPDIQMKSDTCHGRDESSLLNEDASAAEQMLALRDNNVPLNITCASEVVKEPLTYSSKRRNGKARSQKCAPQKNINLGQRSKSSLRLQSDKHQSSMLQYSNGGRNIDDSEDGKLRRKRIRRSSGHSESDDVASLALNSHGSGEENASEIATVESDSNTRNEGNGVDSGSKVDYSVMGGVPEGEYELNEGLNFRINTMVKRKKRKPTRKRTASDIDPPAKVEAAALLGVGARDDIQTLHSSDERFTERPCEGNGDEHLPLVKRARVRMSRAFFGDHDANGSSHVEERSSKDTLVSPTAQTSPSDIVSSHDTYAAGESKVFEVSAKLSGDMVNEIPFPVEKPSDRMSPPDACFQTLGDREHAIGGNELMKATDDHATGYQSNQVSSPSANKAQTTCAPTAVCSEDSQPIELPISESDLPGVQCLHQVSEIELPLDPNPSENKTSGICSSGVPQLSGQHQSQDQDASDSLDKFHESLNEAGDRNDVCVAQISETSEHSSPYCLMENKHETEETENMQKAEGMLLKEEQRSMGEVAQISDTLERSPSSCLMENKQEIEETENMHKTEGMLLKEEQKSMGEVTQISEAVERSSPSCLMENMQEIEETENMPKAEGMLLKEEQKIMGEVAQISDALERSPSSCIMVNKHESQETENMQNPEHSLLKEEHRSLGEVYGSAKPTQATADPPIFATVSDVIVDESEPLNEIECGKSVDTVENSRELEIIGEAKNQTQEVHPKNSVSESENLSREKMSLSPANIADITVRGTPHSNSVYHISTAESANDRQNNNSCSPTVQSGEKKTVSDATVREEEKIETGVCQGQKVVSSDMQSTRESFEDALSSLVRTKESIGRATRFAMDLMRFGVSAKAMEILAHTLESESNLQRRVDLFFLVDSIAQCSKALKGDAGCVYLSAIQVILPRLLAAAVPAGATTQENRRQCLKVLRVWLERRILPESVVRHHIKELDSHTVAPACLYSRRSARTERSLDDPVRDMEGMLVDEYGSNSTLQLPGFCMPAMLKDEDEESDSDSDGENFESVTPEHESRVLEDNVPSSTAERHTLILEDVDGELEMEDVAPPWETGICAHSDQSDNTAKANNFQIGQHPQPVSGSSHQHVSLSSPPLPSSTPPPPPAPPSQQAQCATSDSYSNGFDNMHGDHQAGPPRMNPPMHYQGPESSYSIPHADDSNFQHRPYPSHPAHPHPHPPPPPPPQHQYSYTEPGHHMKSRRDGPSYSHRSHYGPSFDDRNFHDNHDRMRHAPYENRDNWRYPPSSSYGSRYQDKHKGPYPPSSYSGGPPRESGRFQNHRWNHPPRPYSNRHSFHPKPHSEGPPVGMRDPAGMWAPER